MLGVSEKYCNIALLLYILDLWQHSFRVLSIGGQPRNIILGYYFDPVVTAVYI